MAGLIDIFRKRKQDNLTSAIHGIDEEQDNVFNGYNGVAVPDASADGDSSATGEVPFVPVATAADDAAVATDTKGTTLAAIHRGRGISSATMGGSKGGRGLSISSTSGPPFNAVFPNSPNAVPPVDASLQGSPVEPVLAAPAATSPTEVSTSSSAEGNAVTEPKNASQGNVGNNATVTQGDSMNNLEESQNGGQVSVAKKVVRDDLSGMSDADLASRIEKIEQGRERLKGKGVTDEQIDAILGDLHGELNGRKAKGSEGNAAGNIVSGTPGTVVSSGVEKKGGSDNLSNVGNNEETVVDATKRPPYEPEPLNSWATTKQGNNLSNTDNSSTTKDTTAGTDANTDLSKSGNNTDVKVDKEANDSEIKSTEKSGNVDSRQGYGSKIIKLKDNTPKGWPYAEDGGQSGESTGKDKAAGRSNLDDYSAKELEGLTDEQKEQIKNGSVLVVDKDGNKKVVEGTPVLNERQLTAEQNKKEGDVIKTREQINKEIERLADIKEGDSAELKKLKRERAKLSYQIENMPPFVPEEAVYPDMPKKVKTDVNYKRVLERIEQERKDRGDDPETKAKREKAHRANLVVASISDLLSGAINLWGAAHGAKSLDLKSGVAKLEKKHKDQIDEGLKIAEQETKELEKAMKEDQDYDKAVNDAALAEYKEVLKQLREAVRARNTAGQKQWDAKRAELQKRLESANRRVEEQAKYEHRKVINNQRYGQEMSKIAARGAEQRKTKQTRGAGSTVTHVSNGGSSGAGAGSGGGAPAQ